MHPILREILQSVHALDPFPEVASKLLELMMQDDIDPQEVIEVVRTDGGVTAKVLQLANSSQEGARIAIASLDGAKRLGTRRLINLILTTCAESFYAGMGSASLRSSRSLWEESVTNALACRIVAKLQGETDPELAYTVGLLQNIGHVVLDRFLARERDEILGRVDLGMSTIDAEREVLGIDHADVASRLVRKWQFPAILVDTIRHHHAPGRGAVDPTLCAAANLGEGMTWYVLGEDGIASLAYGVSGQALPMTKLTERQFPQIRDELLRELELQRELISSTREEAA